MVLKIPFQHYSILKSTSQRIRTYPLSIRASSLLCVNCTMYSASIRVAKRRASNCADSEPNSLPHSEQLFLIKAHIGEAIFACLLRVRRLTSAQTYTWEKKDFLSMRLHIYAPSLSFLQLRLPPPIPCMPPIKQFISIPIQIKPRFPYIFTSLTDSDSHTPRAPTRGGIAHSVFPSKLCSYIASIFHSMFPIGGEEGHLDTCRLSAEHLK
jgi:hypothetical protein